MADIIQFRRDTAERWAEYNPTLAEGEIGFVLGSTNHYKVGDGVHAWNDLPLKGFNGNIEDELGDRYDSVISQGGLSAILKYIISNGSHIDISKGWDILDEQGDDRFLALESVGLYILMNGRDPAYHMLVTSDNMSHGITQWIFGNLLIDSDGQIRGTHNDEAARILFRSIHWSGSVPSENRGIWTKWQYLQNDFISDDGKGIKSLSEKDLSPSLRLFKETITTIQNSIKSTETSIRQDFTSKLAQTNLGLSTLQQKHDDLVARVDDVEDTANFAVEEAEEAKGIADEALQGVYNGCSVRFHGFINSETVRNEKITENYQICFNQATNFFVAYSNGVAYNLWPNVELYQNSIDTEIKDKVYINGRDLYVFNGTKFTKVGTDYQEAIDILNRKSGAITDCAGIISNGASATNGIYLIKNEKEKIIEIREYNTSGNYTKITPSIGNIFVCNGIYYGWNGKLFNPIGGGSGSGGNGSGSYNVTTQIPLESGYYTLETALAALQDAEDIDDDNKRGAVIKIETSAGNWVEYEFVGTNISFFYNSQYWEEYGGKGAVKKVTLSIGTNPSQELNPDRNGNININVPATEVDETIDENSTNPVQNKAIAAKFKESDGKFGTRLRLNTIEEGGDKAFSISLLNDDGTELDTTEQFTGGGGGGSIQTTKIVLTRKTPNPTVKNGDEVKLTYQYDQIDTATNESTGESANITVTISRGATSNSFTEIVPAGAEKTIDVTKYLGVGSNSVKVRAEVGSGESRQVATVSWLVNVIQLTLTSSYNIGTLVQKGDNIVIPFALTGSGNKMLRCYVDGVDKEDRQITSSSANGSFSIPTSTMSHGAHSVQLVAELELGDGKIIKSNSIYFGVAVRVTGNNAPIIATKFEYQDGTIITGSNVPYIPVRQYENFSVTFAAFNPRETPTIVSIYEQGSLISSSAVAFQLTTLNFRAMSYGTENCKIVCGSTEFNFNLISTKSELDLNEPSDNRKLKLSAQGRSNNDVNKSEWVDGDTTTEMTGFNWGGDGWTGTSLRHKGNARSIVKYNPLQQPMQNANNALAFMIKYKVSEVSDFNTPIISCIDEHGTGFEITPSEVRMCTRGNSQVSMKMAQDTVYEVGFVSFPEYVAGASEYERQNSKMLYLYINGEAAGAVQRGDSDSVYQLNPQNIKIGSDGATTDVYLMRAYDSFLTDNQMLACDILDQDSVDDLLNKYAENDVLDDNGDLSVDSVPNGMRVVIITGTTAEQPTALYAAIQNNKKTKYNVDGILTYIKGKSNSMLNFNLIGGCISLQGTSSLAYPIKNYRIYLYNANKVNGQLYLGCNEQGVGGTLQSDAKYSFREASDTNYAPYPVNCFCLKADFAESSSSHNTGMAKMVHDTLEKCGELTPPQKAVDRSRYNYDVRTTVDGEPCLLFYRNTINDTPIFLGKYNWNNDKSTESVFGFCDIPGYHDAEWVNTKFSGANPTECWEFLNNDYPMGMFKDADFDAKVANDKGEMIPNWLNVFEARFPDDDDINAQYEAGTKKPFYLERLVKWVNSTDTLAAGLTSTQKAQRAKKFRDELHDYFDVDYLCDYYVFTDSFACVDQRVKNMMMAFWYNPDVDKMLAYMIFYDNDTILGVRNDGRLKYDWDVNEETTDPELSEPNRAVYAFAGHDSVLWKNLREQFPEELNQAYRRIRAVLTNSDVFNYFDKQQSDKFCTRIFNIDAVNKYIKPKTIGVDVLEDNNVTHKLYSYLESMQGSRKSQRHYFVTNRMSLFDAKASTGNYTATDIAWKGNSAAGAKVSAVAAREFYFEFKREGTSMYRKKVVDGEEWSYTYGEVANVGTIFHLYGGQWMRKLDLSNWGGFTDLQIPRLPVLEELILGKNSSSYSLTELVIGENLPMLKKLVMPNYVGIPSLNLGSCTKLQHLDARGCSSMSTMTFAESAPLSYFAIPANYQTLVLRSLPLITREGLVFDNIRSVTSLWIENCGQLDGYALFKELFNLDNRAIRNVRVSIGTVEGDGKDLQAYYEARLGGLDVNGNIINNHCKICGDYQLTSYMDDETFVLFSEYFDELNLRQPQYTLINSDDTVSDDRNFSNPDNQTGYDYDNDYVMSGHCAKIWSQRFGCLGKQTKDGEMSICKLNPQNFNYYADGTTINNSTPALLDASEGDAFIYEPNYWYKGINDILGVFSEGRSKKYYAFSSNELMPDIPNVERLTLEDIQNAGNYRKGYKVQLGLSTEIESAISTDGNYSLLKVDVSRHKYVRFPTVHGPLVGAAITDSENNILAEYGVSNLDTKIVEGMYIIVKVPEGGKTLYFSIKNEAVFGWDDVILSNSDKVEDIEPDWVKHEQCLTAMFEATTIGSGLYSVAVDQTAVNNLTQPVFHTYAAQRKLQLVDWEMSKDVANLFFARYGRRNAQAQCGYGSNTNGRIVGSSAFLGMTDTFNLNNATEYAWYVNEGQENVRIACSRFGGYENWWGNVAEWMDKVYLSNSVQTIEGKEFANLPYVYQIIMPDGTIRKARSTSSSGNYVKYVRHQKYMDVISVGNNNNGTQNTFYSDAQWIGGGTHVVYRSSDGAHANGGVSYALAGYGFTYAGTWIGVRLAFRGAIILVTSVSAYKALTAKY